MKKFEIPAHFKSSFISQIKEARKISDPRKKDFVPTCLDFGPVRFYIARHFGFCFGVENAIEISYKAVDENPGKRIFLLSQMIHNQEVNRDLESRGIKFIMDTEGNQFIPWEELTPDDVVIVPAFGTTLEIESKLTKIGIAVEKYNTTCPFVERVWKKSAKLGADDYSIIIHGKHKHEETRATFSHSTDKAPSVVISDMDEAKILGQIIAKEIPSSIFFERFEGRYSDGFNPEKDLSRIGVVNQTTMLATETQAIAEYLKQVVSSKFGEAVTKDHFADTRDTLCYATNDNQEATYGLLAQSADFAIVVGGYNSSNTSHIVELCEQKLPTYFISSAEEIDSNASIHHFNYHQKERVSTENYIPSKERVDIILTSGASCPDTLVDNVMNKLLSYFEGTRLKEDVLKEIIDAE